MKPLVSIVIATRNEARNIGNCLKSLNEQSYKNLELIVVDNNSSDKTFEIAKRLTSNVFRLNKNVLKNVKNFRGTQVNFGVSKSKGGIIFFPDADMTFDRDLISDAVKKLEVFDALFIPEFVMGKGLFGKIRNFERSFYNGTCIDGVRFVKKSVFDSVGGFDVKNIVFGPDDWDLTKTLKNKFRLGITSKRLFHHEEWLDLKTYLQKKKKYADTFSGYINKWTTLDTDIKKQLGAGYRLIGVFVENGKWINLIKHPFLTLGMYYVRFRVALNYFFYKFFKKK